MGGLIANTEDFDILYLAAPRRTRNLGGPSKGCKAFAEAQAHWVGPQMRQLRLKANLLVLLKDATKLLEAEQLFRPAIQIEQSCGAKWFELLSTLPWHACCATPIVATRCTGCSPKSTTGSPMSSTPTI